jgi:transcriptional regulator with XRE-family HTH domain
MSDIGSRIKRLREREGLSQEVLAKALGVSRPAITEIEKGRRRVSSDELVVLSKVFRVSVDYLLGLSEEPTVHIETEKGKGGKKTPMRINVPQKNVEKFREVLLYVLGKIGAKPNVGETVLYKLLYFIDFDYYETYEEQLIGATYIRNHFGPTPIEFRDLVDHMIEDKELAKIQRPYFEYEQKKYLPLRSPDLSRLSAQEIELINDVLNRLSDMTAKEISTYSHNDIPWQITPEGEAIEYESVFYRTPAYSAKPYGEEDGEVQ